jgi:hypothetical protein
LNGPFAFLPLDFAAEWKVLAGFKLRKERGRSFPTFEVSGPKTTAYFPAPVQIMFSFFSSSSLCHIFKMTPKYPNVDDLVAKATYSLGITRPAAGTCDGVAAVLREDGAPPSSPVAISEICSFVLPSRPSSPEPPPPAEASSSPSSAATATTPATTTTVPSSEEEAKPEQEARPEEGARPVKRPRLN